MKLHGLYFLHPPRHLGAHQLQLGSLVFRQDGSMAEYRQRHQECGAEATWGFVHQEHSKGKNIDFPAAFDCRRGKRFRHGAQSSIAKKGARSILRGRETNPASFSGTHVFPCDYPRGW
jgi:hypothetical protein